MLALRSIPSSAFLVILIAISKIASITGKLSTAIRILLLVAFDAMPEIRLNEEENPNEVRNRVDRNNTISSTGFSRNKENRRYPDNESTKHNAVL